MIGHDYEIVNLKALRGDAVAQHINEKLGEPIGLQQMLAHARFCCHEKRARVGRGLRVSVIA